MSTERHQAYIHSLATQDLDRRQQHDVVIQDSYDPTTGRFHGLGQQCKQDIHSYPTADHNTAIGTHAPTPAHGSAVGTIASTADHGTSIGTLAPAPAHGTSVGTTMNNVDNQPHEHHGGTTIHQNRDLSVEANQAAAHGYRRDDSAENLPHINNACCASSHQPGHIHDSHHVHHKPVGLPVGTSAKDAPIVGPAAEPFVGVDRHLETKVAHHSALAPHRHDELPGDMNHRDAHHGHVHSNHIAAMAVGDYADPHPRSHHEALKKEENKAIARDSSEPKGERIKAAIKVPAEAIKHVGHKVAEKVHHDGQTPERI